MMKFKSLFRRGQQGKQETALKGAPSVSSLDSKHHKVAPARDKSLKIFGSKEKLNKAHKKKDSGNNNVAPGDSELREVLEYEDGQVMEYGSVELVGSHECVSLPVTLDAEHMPGFRDLGLRPGTPSQGSAGGHPEPVEAEALRLELAERARLQARLDELLERAGEADQLRAELDRLKGAEAEREAALERLADENGALRARLRGVAHSPLSDSEKRQLLLAPAPRRMHSSAPASIALAHNAEGDGGDGGDATPDWDKHSSSSLSEVSVACLQDRILQMEEHHYSTSEELQATLAELADLQSQLVDAHADNERLADEKQVLLESLCRQTEKLEDSRTKVDTLQELLLREGVEPEALDSGDVDQQLLAVLKLSQEERRLLLCKQEQLEAELTEVNNTLEEKTKENETLAERVRNLEASLERAETGRAHWEQEAGAARELASARQHQLAKLGDLLDAAKAKLAGFAEGAAAAEAAEAAAAATARREADAAAARAHALAERLAHAQRQLDLAHDDARKLHDDAMVSRNNAKSTISELEFQLEQLQQENAALQGELNTLRENMSKLQIEVQVASDEKLSLMSRAGEAQAHAADLERQLQDERARCTQLERDRERDEAEWKQFQNDLLLTVRVAHNFKTEAERKLERVVTENKAARERIRILEDEMHSLRGVNRSESPSSAQFLFDYEKQYSKYSDGSESPSESSPKDIFRDIRTRYLSRVRSATDAPSKDFHSIGSNRADVGCSPDSFALKIEDVTTDETDDYSTNTSPQFVDRSESGDERNLLLRQKAVDFCKQKLIRQDAMDFDRMRVPQWSSVRRDQVLKSDSCDLSLPASKFFFKNNLSALYKGKPKSLSMDNINVNQRYKDSLKEATSIEFLGSHSFSDISLCTDGSDSVFLAPLERKNNNISEVEKSCLPPIHNFNTNNMIVTKLPLQPLALGKDDFEMKSVDNPLQTHVSPRSGDLGYNNDNIIQKKQQQNSSEIITDESIEKNMKKVNEEIKLNFEAAIDRIIGSNRSSPVTTTTVTGVSASHRKDISTIDDFVENYRVQENCLNTKSSSSRAPPTSEDSKSSLVLKEVSNVNSNVRTAIPSVHSIEEKTSAVGVSYRLKIHTPNDLQAAASDDGADATPVQPAHAAHAQRDNKNNGQAILAPVHIVNTNVDMADGKGSPVIISPVSIRPIFIKSNPAVGTVGLAGESTRGMVYYDDIDQVIVGKHTHANKTTELPPTDSPKRGIYQKNTKFKHSPFLSWKSNENVIQTNSFASKECSELAHLPNAEISKFKKTPAWLIDNHYYQTMENTLVDLDRRRKQDKTSGQLQSQTVEVETIPVPNIHLSVVNKRREYEMENYYEEIGAPATIGREREQNAADDRVSTGAAAAEELPVVAREEILKVPRKPKSPRNQKLQPADGERFRMKRTVQTNFAKTPSARVLIKKHSSSSEGVPGNLGNEAAQSETSEWGESLSRGRSERPRAYHWETLEHKRLSHPIRSLNGPAPARPLPAAPRAEEPPAPPPLLTSASLQDIMASAASHRRTKGCCPADYRLMMMMNQVNVCSVVRRREPAGLAALRQVAHREHRERGEGGQAGARRRLAAGRAARRAARRRARVPRGGRRRESERRGSRRRCGRGRGLQERLRVAPRDLSGGGGLAERQAACARAPSHAAAARVRRHQRAGRGARAGRQPAAEGDRVVRAAQQLRRHLREEGPAERAAGQERRLEAERAAQVVPTENHGLQQHRHHQLQLLVERRAGAVRAAALVRGRRARAVRGAVAARQAQELRARVRGGGGGRHPHHAEHTGHDPAGATRLAAGDGVCHQHIQALRDIAPPAAPAQQFNIDTFHAIANCIVYCV